MSTRYLSTDSPAKDYAERIKRFRRERGLTQEGLAEELGVSFATVNRWENRQTKPSKLYWQQLQNVEKQVREVEESYGTPDRAVKVPLDFSADPEAVRVLA